MQREYDLLKISNAPEKWTSVDPLALASALEKSLWPTMELVYSRRGGQWIVDGG